MQRFLNSASSLFSALCVVSAILGTLAAGGAALADDVFDDPVDVAACACGFNCSKDPGKALCVNSCSNCTPLNCYCEPKACSCAAG